MKRSKFKRKLSRTSALTAYEEGLKKVRLVGLESKLSEQDVNNVMEECIQSLLVSRRTSNLSRDREGLTIKALGYVKRVASFLKKILMLLCVLLVITCILYITLQNKPIQYFVQSKLQDFIYPGMKILRKLFLPIIYLYPSLTDWYDESCLVVNPFFRVPNMPCPCEEVRAVLNLTGEDMEMDPYHPGIPYMIKVNREEVSWTKLKELYTNHSAVFDRDASHLTMSFSSVTNEESSPAFLFNSDLSFNGTQWDHAHVKWRCNRLEPSRLLRSIFGIPESEPNYASGVTIEKIIMIDGPKTLPYRMPTTDGTTVFIQQSSGSRVIVLSPANECKEKCSTVSVELPPHHILWFSWWYWRASSLPSPASDTASIVYMGSYL